MHHLASALSALLNDHFTALEALPEEVMSHKPSPLKWSKKEIIGHLVDSAQNNIRRFIVAQYEDSPGIVYNQDKWVAISNYQQYNTAELLQLWLLLNKQICRILENTVAETAKRLCDTGQQHSIEWLAEDYITHLKHHLHQVLGLESIPYS